MKLKYFFLITFSFFLCAFFNYAQAVEPSTSTTATSSPSPQANDDGKIIAFLIVLNKNEIAFANEALKRKVGPAVRNYALVLRKDHTNGLKATEMLSNKIHEQPVDTPETDTLKQQGSEKLKELRALNGPRFVIVFVDAMVKGHQAALDKIDESMAKTNNPDLKKHLEATRARVKRHLQAAQVIQNRINTH